MPSWVNPEKCDGCKALERTACEYICPNDLMVLDKEAMKAYNREPDMCWECYSCVKMCPQQAVECRGYLDYSPLGGSVIPLRGTDAIMWTIKYRNGKVLRFKFPIRTTPEGSIQPFEGFPEPSLDGLKTQQLAGEPDILGVPFPEVKLKQ
ncbi:adenylyl-sulfate reductase subunit beta [Archaeoglobales archaeon]|nr:MAG: adenylyl-sulfate reductase subunit beta [Archaeoglobales archaeon]